MRHVNSIQTFNDALEILVGAADDNIRRARLVKRRIAWIKKRMAAGDSLAQIVQKEPRPLVTELLTENIDALHTAGSFLRWAEANELKNQGMTVAEIARQLGVSRQRISALLQKPPQTVAAWTGSTDAASAEKWKRG